MDNNLKDLVVEPLEMNKNTNEKIDLQKNELKVIPLQNAPVQAPQVENKKTAVKEKKKKLRDMWEKVESNMPSYLEEGDRLNKSWLLMSYTIPKITVSVLKKLLIKKGWRQAISVIWI